jgi:RNase H-like domain found in reverse transcriptase
LGLIQYLQHFMPNVFAYMAPLSGMTRNHHTFEWRPIHQKCFDMIKMLACRTSILCPIDIWSPNTIWVICDASTSGVGALYSQGLEWNTCRLAGFMSKKFCDTQFNYRVFEMETLAILEALLKWEDKLIGHKFTMVTDH